MRVGVGLTVSSFLRKDLRMPARRTFDNQDLTPGGCERYVGHSPLPRRQFLKAATHAISAVAVKPARADVAEGRVTVGAHPWVYAAKQPRYDIYPILDRIFADV